ncbi:MAG: type II and III secretion system protein family protein [Pseudomonadota bacterium]|nr:type II and III secretion system protein family protein [Pseudomonadota bacterium]
MANTYGKIRAADRGRSTASRLRALLIIGLAALVGSPGVALDPRLAAAESAAIVSSMSKFVRMGVNKSIVVRLPAAAKDVIVGNPGIVDAVIRTQNRAYLFARAVGQTNIFFFDAQGRQILSLDIEVARDPLALQRLIERAIPGTKITVDTINDNIVLGGVAANPAEAQKAMDLAVQLTGDAKKVVSTIAVNGREQVMLKVRVAEMQRTVLKQLGINTDSVFSIGKFTADFFNVNPFTLSSAGPLNASTNSFAYGDNFQAVVRAMERDGLLRTLAEPTLTAVSGESAKFLAGGEFPVPVAVDTTDGERKVEIEFKPFGVGLGFSPVVMSEDLISLRINTEVSELTEENAFQEIRALKVRRAETTVELPSGGSMVMAGLIQDVVKQHINGIPGLKNLPVLGQLFRSRDFQKDETELVVIVTPYIVKPVNEKELATPLDRFNVATDRQTIFLGRLNKVYGAAGLSPKGVYHGHVGFIVE